MFENIKVGDKVLIQHEVRIGWGNYESFWMPAKVDKVTPKQFVIGDKRYKKIDGNLIGAHFDKAKHIGEEKDQTKERNDLVKRANTAYEIKNIIADIKLDHNSKNLFDVLVKIKEIEEIINLNKEGE